MIYEEGYKKAEVARALSVSKTAVKRWCDIFEEGGWDSLKLGRRGRRAGERTKLSSTQCDRVIKWITDNTPEQLKMPFVLWTAAAVRDLIKEKFGILLPLRTMRRYLRKWNFTPQKPIKKAWQQNSEAVRKWVEEQYPKIAKRAKERGATIFWVDETGVSNKANSQRGYAPRGKTPVLKHDGPTRKVNMISGVTNRGAVRFMCYTATMTQHKFILFLSKLIKSADGPIVVITDNLSVHHGKKVASWVAERADEIELHFIPGYSPELNADEYLNRDLKKNVNAKTMPSTVVELKANVISFMRSIQKHPDRVMQYFSGRHICYAK
jgi:transposase